ncbi:MAG: hypothetical protein CM15mP105_2420 [Methanobacteriota archaeon]|nr:MAG: hypothetical protein CM15mP105_2420 [Euryarchaeota archaeon]
MCQERTWREKDLDEDGFPELSQAFTLSQTKVPWPLSHPRYPELPISHSLSRTKVKGDDLELMFLPDDQNLAPVSTIFDNETKPTMPNYNMGNWVLNYTYGEKNKQLWQRVEVAESDISESFQFLVSQSVNGIVLNKPDKDGSAPQAESRVNNQQVVFQWEGFT